MDRRYFLTAGALLVAGCSSDGGDSDVQDSDGDGMIDSEDYAPNDPDVQEKSDLQGGGSTPAATPSPTPTEEPDAIDAVNDIEFPSDSPTPEDDSELDIGTIDDSDVLTAWSEPFNYEETVIVPGPGYYQVPIEFDQQFTINWKVTNQRSSEYDFDVFLFGESEYQTYLDYTNDRDSHRPEYYPGGSAQGIVDSAVRTATLSAGKYRLLVDNSDYGDAGDIGSEAGREVTIDLHAEET